MFVKLKKMFVGILLILFYFLEQASSSLLPKSIRGEFTTKTI